MEDPRDSLVVAAAREPVRLGEPEELDRIPADEGPVDVLNVKGRA